MLQGSGFLETFGDAPYLGSASPGSGLAGITTPNPGLGYWEATSAGVVYAWTGVVLNGPPGVVNGQCP